MIDDSGLFISPDCKLFKTDNHVLLTFNKPMDALSSCVFNGGLQKIRHVLNVKVDGNDSVIEDPAVTLSKTCVALGLNEKCIGMLTAASMNSLRFETYWFGDLCFSSIVTSGLDNARRAGDAADVMEKNVKSKVGTINLVVVTNAFFPECALVEAVMMATEAKVAVLESLNIKSPKSGKLATGTGTDAIAIVSDPDGLPLPYVGKHVLAGEKLAQSVIAALTASLERN